MSRRAFHIAGALAFVVATVYLLVRLGAAGWFTLTFALALIGVTIALFWGYLIAGIVSYATIRLALWRMRRAAK